MNNLNQGLYEITKNQKIAKTGYKMTLHGDTSHLTAPGQFVNIKLDGFYLRRPISICDYDDKEITIIYKTVGEGTLAMSRQCLILYLLRICLIKIMN